MLLSCVDVEIQEKPNSQVGAAFIWMFPWKVKPSLASGFWIMRAYLSEFFWGAQTLSHLLWSPTVSAGLTQHPHVMDRNWDTETSHWPKPLQLLTGRVEMWIKAPGPGTHILQTTTIHCLPKTHMCKRATVFSWELCDSQQSFCSQSPKEMTLWRLMFVAARADLVASGRTKLLKNTHRNIFYCAYGTRKRDRHSRGCSCTIVLTNRRCTGTSWGKRSLETRLDSLYLVRKR